MSPPKFADASFKNTKAYNPAVLEVCKEYVKNWPDMYASGTGLVLAGPTGLGKSYAAAAVRNEIWNTWENTLTSTWFSCSYSMQTMLDWRQLGSSDKYLSQWRRLTEDHLIIVDDLLHVSDYLMAKQLIVSLYEYRDQYQKPIITTMNGQFEKDEEGAYIGPIATVFNEPFVRKLEDNCAGYIVSSEEAK